MTFRSRIEREQRELRHHTRKPEIGTRHVDLPSIVDCALGKNVIEFAHGA